MTPWHANGTHSSSPPALESIYLVRVALTQSSLSLVAVVGNKVKQEKKLEEN